MFIKTYIPTYKGNSLRKSLRNHCCNCGFPFEVRSCHVISCICIAISDSGNANSHVVKTKALMHRFSQLSSISFRGFDVNRTDNISMLQNSITYIYRIIVPVTTNLRRRTPLFPCMETTIPIFRNSSSHCTLVDSTARDIRHGTPNCMILGSFNSEGPKHSADA